ncbi:MAG: DUF1624 domain-containing protein [Lachnospiraceae bacterium]
MNKMRYEKLDGIRGMALLHMIAYHTIWDLVYPYQFDWNWYKSKGAYLWQQGICWTFIFLSGFCWSLGSRAKKRGIIVFLSGAVITIVTLVLMPQNRIVFGVLTLIGSCMLLMQAFDRWLRRLPALVGIVGSFLLFFLTRNINEGWLGFAQWNVIQLPEVFYCNIFMTYLGFTQKNFYSTDYFSLFPWIFLFLAGYFTYRLSHQKNGMQFLEKGALRPIEWIGRHSLKIYMVHQPIIYVMLELGHRLGIF